MEHVALETEGTLQLATARGAAAPRRNARRGGRAQGGKEAGVHLLFPLGLLLVCMALILCAV